MSSYEWMELQTLTSDIAASRSRLVAARSAKDNRLARVLEQEIGEAERRRDLLLANITDQVAGQDEPASSAEPGATEAPLTLEPAEVAPEEVVPEDNAPQQPAPSPEPTAAEFVVSRPTEPQAART
jgi:hypothetical protein